MSRSRRLAIIKDKPRNSKRTSKYWRQVRSRINQEIRKGNYDNLPEPKTIVNDYDYMDYKFTPEFDSPKDYVFAAKSEGISKEEALKRYRKKYRRK